MNVTPYLFFNGTCEEALKFLRKDARRESCLYDAL